MFQFVFLALVAAACAAPQNQDVQIVRYDSDNTGLGAYNFASVPTYPRIPYQKFDL